MAAEFERPNGTARIGDQGCAGYVCDRYTALRHRPPHNNQHQSVVVKVGVCFLVCDQSAPYKFEPPHFLRVCVWVCAKGGGVVRQSAAVARISARVDGAAVRGYWHCVVQWWDTR